MVKAEEYKGIEFVRLSKLPPDEAEQIAGWSKTKKITILTEVEKWRDCIQFQDYKQWYEKYYRPSSNPVSNIVGQGQSEEAPKRNFTFGFMRYFHNLLQKN